MFQAHSVFCPWVPAEGGLQGHAAIPCTFPHAEPIRISLFFAFLPFTCCLHVLG